MPFVYRPLRRAYHGLRSWPVRRERRRLLREITNRVGWQVQAGPFAGMRYIDVASGSALIPKVLGTYEDELYPAIGRFLEKAYSTVIDIGCAEGYYAVGMALRLPTAIVHAYDLDAAARTRCAELARQNGVVQRVVIHEKFTPDQLPELPGHSQLVICDIEGDETKLFTPATARYWQHADLIVELHDFLGLPCRESVRHCLADTHTIEIISSRRKTPPEIAGLSRADLQLAVDELRPPQEWLIAMPRG